MSATVYPVPDHIPPIVRLELERRREWLAEVPGRAGLRGGPKS